MDFTQLVSLKGIPFPLIQTDHHPCPYLEGRMASELMALAPSYDEGLVQKLIDLGFRRSQNFFYRPQCPSCQLCTPIRVQVNHFKMSSSQKKVLKKNQDIRIEVGVPILDDQRYEMYEKYQKAQHDGCMSCSPEYYQQLFCDSPISTLEMTYWLEDKLVGIGIIDMSELGLSSVYFSYDPDFQKRSLGVFSALKEIDYCSKLGKDYWYIGYYIDSCVKMNYKSRFKPYELMQLNGQWEVQEDNK